ncbi:MAG: hypothetical protein E7357_07220 [Clostridiales bacterium]|nr:hypothetical protein [Clostridiales bacterium]
MKKKWLLLAGSMMLAATMGFAVACSEEETSEGDSQWSRGAKDISKLALNATKTTTITEVDIPTDYDGEYEMAYDDYNNPIKDNSGLWLMYKRTQDNNYNYIYEYRFFDWTTGELSSAKKTLSSAERNRSTCGFLGDGALYFGITNDDGDVEYTVYTRDKEQYIGLASLSNGTLTAENGTRYYVTPSGEFVEETDEFVRFYSYSEAKASSSISNTFLNNNSYYGGYNYKTENYFINKNDTYSFYVYDANGAYVRTEDLAREWDLTINVQFTKVFTMGDRIVAQYLETLPQDATEYELFKQGTKYNLSTVYYDVESGKSGEWENFNFIINEDLYMLNYAELLVNEIVDGQQSTVVSAITVDKDGKGYVDVEALVEGALYFMPDKTGFVVVQTLDTAYYYKGKKLVLETTGYADVYETVLVVEGNSKLYIYDLNSQLIETISGVVDYEDTSDGNFCYQTEGGLYTYDVKTKQSSLLVSLNDRMQVDIYSDYVIIEDEGLNEYYYLDSDDYVSVYFFNDVMEDIVRINGAIEVETEEIFNQKNSYAEILFVAVEYYNGSDADFCYLITQTYELK